MSARLPVFAFLLSACTALPAQAEITFDGKWDNFGKQFVTKQDNYTWVSNYTPGTWHMLQAVSQDRMVVQNDATSPKGGAVARVYVKSGDYLGYSGERVETSRMLRWDAAQNKTVQFPVYESSGHEYYGISVKLAPDWQSPGKDKGTGPVWGLFLQLHSPDNYNTPPAIALAAEGDFHLNMCSGDVMEGGTRTTPKDGTSYPFSRGELNRGRWVQFMLDVVWSYGNNGSVKVFRRDEGETAFTKVLELNNLPTLQTRSGMSEGTFFHYWKTGFYRSATPNITNVLWLGPVVRGTSFDEVADRAFSKTAAQ